MLLQLLKKNAASVIFVVFGVTALVMMDTQIVSKNPTIAAEAKQFPTLMLSMMVILSALSLVVEYLKLKKAAKATDDAPVFTAGMRKVIIVIVAIALWTVLITKIGFIISTAALLLVITLIAGNRKPVSIALLTVVCPLLVYYIFSQLLNTRLPEILFK